MGSARVPVSVDSVRQVLSTKENGAMISHQAMELCSHCPTRLLSLDLTAIVLSMAKLRSSCRMENSMRETSEATNAVVPAFTTTKMVISTMVSGQMTAGLGVDVFSKRKEVNLAACSSKTRLMATSNSKTQRAICSRLRMRKLKRAKRPSNAARKRIARSQRELRKIILTYLVALPMANSIIWV